VAQTVIPDGPGGVPVLEPRGMGANIEIIEPYTSHYSEREAAEQALVDLPCIKPRLVRVNGTDVGLLAKDGISIDPGEGFGEDTGRGHPTVVTLRLLAKSVTIKAE
jgi:hypothetical protein